MSRVDTAQYGNTLERTYTEAVVAVPGVWLEELRGTLSVDRNANQLHPDSVAAMVTTTPSVSLCSSPL